MSSRRLSLVPRAVALTVASTALVACGSPDTSDLGADVDEISTLAVEEGKLVVYSAATEEVNSALVAAFGEKHPDIDVTVTKLSSGDLRSRFASETSSGAQSADAVIATDTVMFTADPDWFTGYTEEQVPNLADVREGYTGESHFSVVTSPWVVTFNDQKLSEGPVTWQDLAKPQYAGKTTLADPKVSTDSVMSFYQLLMDEYGADFLATLGKQNKDWFDSSVPAVQKVAAGQVALAAPGARAHSLALSAAGAPLEVVTPQPVVAFTNNFGAASAAQNPNAAAVFADFLLSPEGQSAFCGDQLYMSLIEGEVEGCTPTPDDVLLADPLRANKDRDAILAAFELD